MSKKDRVKRTGGQKKGQSAQARSVRKFTIKMQKKLIVVGCVVLGLFALLSARLVWIVTEKEEEYTKQVLSQRRYDSTTLPYRRGDILDAKGNRLATSEKVYNLIIDARVMLETKDALEPTIAALTEYFGLDAAAVREYVTTHENSSWYVAKKQLSYEEISGYLEAEAAKGSKLAGVWFEEEYKRFYPNNSLACDVIGFSGRDNRGSYGLEEYYNDVLNGTTGREYGYLTEDSTLERTVKPAVDGHSIHTTIDMNIQKIVEKYLKAFNDEYANKVREGNGAENIGCIIMEVDTGNVLAMASYPFFDLNNTRDPAAMYGNRMVEEVVNQNGYIEIHKTDTVISENVVANMTEEQLYLNLNYLWKNYCITDTYEPGSTAKPFTVAAALETGSITGNEVYQCNGSLNRGGHDIKCHVTYGQGPISVEQSIAQSCNVALMYIAEALGADDFGKFQEIFNFGLKTNIDLAGEARTVGLLFDPKEMKEADLATNSFGQNFNVTMIQMIAGYCSLINGGYYYEPHVVSKITNASGATVQTIEPRVLKQTISESTSAKIRQYTKETVMGEKGSGKAARPAGYAIGGKTGTAETLPRGNKEYVVSFLGHAPADDPEIAIYVVVDRGNVEKQDSSKLASGIVRNILQEVLPYLNIFMTEALSEEEAAELAAKELENTSQYTQTPEGEDLSQEEEKEEAAGEGEGEGEPAEGEDPNADQPIWMSFPVDEETGYPKDPETGQLVDPETGEFLTGYVPPAPDTMSGRLDEPEQ